jgi:hypothetical protein
MIHVTFRDGKTAIYDPHEIVGVCDWISDDGTYFSGDAEVDAENLEVGMFLFDEFDQPSISLTPIVSIRNV